MAFFIHPNQFIHFFRDPDEKFTPEVMKAALEEAGVIVSGEAEPIELRWDKDGPPLYASIDRGDVAPILATRLMGRGRKHRELAKTCDTTITVTFADLDAVLDEINTLIVVQATLQEAVGGLIYRSWNGWFTGPDE